MLAGGKKEDQEAMLAAQKLANENFEATKKAMTAPPPVQRQEPGLSVNIPVGNSFMTVPADFVPSVTTGFGGKPAPAQPPQPLI